MQMLGSGLCVSTTTSWTLPIAHQRTLAWRQSQPILKPGLGRRLLAVQAAADSRKSHGTQSPTLTPEDIKRRRLRWGDRPSNSWRRKREQAQPGLLEQLQQLKSGEEAAALGAATWQRLVQHTNNFLGRKLYEYFNWRQDTSKDLVVTFGVFSTLVLAAGAVRRWAVDYPADRAEGNLWTDVYQVGQWVFGQEFPGPDSPLGQQVMSVGTAVVGLAAFAMVLALVEQVVLETLEANVKRGSKVFESGHILVLGWCVSQRDMEVVRKVVQQVCVAHAPEGGTTVVVMTQRSKLEMEAMFRRCLPESKRFGTSLVFRQGSPLVPSDLKLVAACRAAATIVVSDQSRSAAEADAQAVRCAILLDELEDKREAAPYLTAMAAAATSVDCGSQLAPQLDLSLMGRHVVVELKTANALPLLKYACSSRIMALPTSQLNAQRLAKMVKRPVISIISQQLFNFENGVSLYIHYYPHLVGTRFGDLAYLFTDGIVMGLVDRATGKARMAPNKDCFVQPSHALVICRPTSISSHSYGPLAAAPSRAQLKLQEALATWVGPHGRSMHGGDWQLETTPVSFFDPATAAAQQATGSVSSNSKDLLPPGRPGWSSSVSQVDLLRHQVAAASLYSAGQPSVGSVESAAAGLQPQEGGLTPANNILPAKLGSVTVTAMHLVMQQSTAAAAAYMGLGPSSSGSNSRGSNCNSAVAQHISAGSDTAVLNRPGPALRNAGADSSGSVAWSSSGGSRGPGHAALRTGDWPVLSGAHEHAGGKPLWRVHRNGRPPPQPRKKQQTQRRRLASMVDEAVGGWGGGYAADSSGEHGAGARLLAVTCSSSSSSSSKAEALNDAAVLVPPEYFQVDEHAEKVCVLGWGPNSLMVDLIKELDHGLSALPKGSEVVFVNMHNPYDSLGQALQHVSLENVQVRHVTANPLQRSSLAGALDVSVFRCALVLCDELWVDPDNNDANGLDSLDEPSVLRLDSLVMVAQLNMRKLLEDSKLPAINVICQKVATEGLTRFEDRHRLPLGISVNLNSFSAKMLAQIAANPLMLVPVTRLGEDAMLTILDSSRYAALGEELNFWQLMARCQTMGDVLLGYYEIPEHLDEPLNTVVNPIGLEVRSTSRVWNKGDSRLKFILLCHKQYRPTDSTSGSHDDIELENTKQAGWVAARERSPQASSHGSHHSHPNSWTDTQ